MGVSLRAVQDLIFPRDLNVVEGDFIYVNKLTNVLSKANASSIDTMPAVGYVVETFLDGTCRIERIFIQDSVSGITHGAFYFISDTESGGVQDDPPEGVGKVVQKVARGFFPDKLDIVIDPSAFTIRS